MPMLMTRTRAGILPLESVERGANKTGNGATSVKFCHMPVSLRSVHVPLEGITIMVGVLHIALL